MKQYKDYGYIFVKNELGIPMCVSKIEYILNEDESFKYIFYPNYKVIDLLDCNIFQGIPGLNLDLRKKTYIRENKTPVFISERVPQSNREDLYNILKDLGMDYMNPIEYLSRTKLQYTGDRLYVLKGFNILQSSYYKDINELGINVMTILTNILKEMGLGNNLFFNNFKIDDSNYKDMYNLLTSLLNKQKKYMKKSDVKPGRIQKQRDLLKILSNIKDYQNKIKTVEEVTKNLGISESTFYRYLRKYKDEI